MQNAASSSGLRTVVVCMLANNLTLGLIYGTFGAMLSSNEQAFAVARDTISFGMSAVATTTGLSALLMGKVVRRITPRIAILIGTLSAAVAFGGLGLTTSITVALAMWALLGFSAAMAAILGPVAIAAEFFPAKSGKFLAMVNLPVVLFVSPWLVTAILPALGRDGVYMAMALCLLPISLLVLLALPKGTGTTAAPPPPRSGKPDQTMLSRADFWLITLGIAVIAGTGTAFTVHAIPYAQAEGLSVSASALMFSAYMGAGLVGVPFFGWLADRIGAPRALALSGLVQCLCWAGLGTMPPVAFVPIAALLGAATTPLTTLHGAAMAQIFGAARVGTAMGYSFAIKLPFLFVAAPAVGYVYVKLVDYRPALLAVSATLVVAVILLLIGGRLGRAMSARQVNA
ncbi:MFS family permease [Novosphingobium hassiacum]|uniref:MFS family permease n=1 Tax=Novosphingobium hassiacum TaxID=173676 RepID=A0A7W5ZUG9_9SPHN|nr:MFS transporter [Novosphingobium hassiacum]MBB3860183.1 MFS family permease [Novosphingobium hassiacum]